MSIQLRIKELRESAKMTQKEFSQVIGVDNSQYSKIEQGKIQPTIQQIMEISSNFNVTTDWLLTGNENKLQKEKESKQYSIEPNTNIAAEPQMSIYKLKTDYFGTDRQSIPLYEIDAAAGLNTLFSSQATQVPLDFIIVPNAPRCDGAIFVRGDSMYPILKAGDIICYKTIFNIDNLIFGEMYLLEIDNGDDIYLTVKFVQKSELGNDYIKLVSENNYHAARDIPLMQVKALAIIKLSIRYNTIS